MFCHFRPILPRAAAAVAAAGDDDVAALTTSSCRDNDLSDDAQIK